VLEFGIDSGRILSRCFPSRQSPFAFAFDGGSIALEVAMETLAPVENKPAQLVKTEWGAAKRIAFRFCFAYFGL
jgi:hypothetical protein